MAEKKTAGETALQIYKFNEKDANVRIQMIDGNPWFVVKDLCAILEHSNHKVAIQGLDDDEVRKVYLTDSLGREQETYVVNESGFYALVIRSNKPVGRKLRKWVTSEVLPSIRRTGGYGAAVGKAVGKATGRPRITRGELVTADLMNLLWLIGESLRHGDQKQVAMELGVSVQTVNRTLNGYNRSNRVLSALYHKAMQRRAHTHREAPAENGSVGASRCVCRSGRLSGLTRTGVEFDVEVDRVDGEGAHFV